MNTPAHIAVGLAVLARRGSPQVWAAVIAGALLPDLILLLAHSGNPFPKVGPGLVPVFNSLPLYTALALLGWLTGRRWLLLLAGAAALHILFDLPLHNHDARPHFWPISDARFVSPVSFWDPDRFGLLIGTLEGVLFLACFAVIWRRSRLFWQRALAVLLAAAYFAAFVHFAGHALAGRHWAFW